jgi:hypothetical protein
MLRWPAEFGNQTPGVSFSSEFVEFLHKLNDDGILITADSHWSLFAFRNDWRMVDFICRGRRFHGKDMCWEVGLHADGCEIQLGRQFGMRDYACVVTEGFHHVQTVTELWLGNGDISALLKAVPFWDRVSPREQLSLPRTPDSE